jgi:endoglucanase
MANKFIAFMKEAKISWTNWNFSDDHRTGAVFKSGTCSGSSFSGEGPLKDAGKWVRNHIRTADDF